MKTKMIRGLRVLVFDDINKTGRKFHLCYVICSAPQVAAGPSDTQERRRRNQRKFQRGGALISTLNQKLMSTHVSWICNQGPLNRYMKCRWAQLSAHFTSLGSEREKPETPETPETDAAVESWCIGGGLRGLCLHI